jgi:two-component system chemotaxis response regulator CheB
MTTPIKILVVDDSAFMRLTLSKRLSAEPGFELVGVAPDGEAALAQMRTLKPDVITMDVEMPRLNGLETLARIMAEQPTPVIMVSSLTREGTETTARALTLGAVDCVAKPAKLAGAQDMAADLANRIRQVAGVRVRRLAIPPAPAARTMPANGAAASSGGYPGATGSTASAMLNLFPRRADKMQPRPLQPGDAIITIASSTGGPGALRQLLADLPAGLNATGVIVQHMPAGFTQSLANHLDSLSAWQIKEAVQADRLMAGQILLAPGGLHMAIGRRGEVTLASTPPVNNVRPAADITMTTVAEAFGRRVLGVVLTGMGHDGTEGALAIRRAGGRVIAEAESSCVVYGMPRSAVEAGAVDNVAPLTEIAAVIQRLLRGN